MRLRISVQFVADVAGVVHGGAGARDALGDLFEGFAVVAGGGGFSADVGYFLAEPALVLPMPAIIRRPRLKIRLHIPSRINPLTLRLMQTIKVQIHQSR